jgi:hypothetical protein
LGMVLARVRSVRVFRALWKVFYRVKTFLHRLF